MIRRGASGDARLEQGAQPLVTVGAAAGHDAIDGASDHRRGAELREGLRVYPGSHPEPLDPCDCAGNQFERGLSLPPGDGQARLGVGTQLLGLKQTSGQHALRSFGDVEDGFRRDRNRDREPGPIVPAPTDDRWDEQCQFLSTGVGGQVVDLPCQLRKQRMCARGVVAPPLTGEHRGEFHEARATSWRAMSAT
jgi:hypothetical protein